jgi:hypothetical protein
MRTALAAGLNAAVMLRAGTQASDCLMVGSGIALVSLAAFMALIGWRSPLHGSGPQPRRAVAAQLVATVTSLSAVAVAYALAAWRKQ